MRYIGIRGRVSLPSQISCVTSSLEGRLRSVGLMQQNDLAIVQALE